MSFHLRWVGIQAVSAAVQHLELELFADGLIRHRSTLAFQSLMMVGPTAVVSAFYAPWPHVPLVGDGSRACKSRTNTRFVDVALAYPIWLHQTVFEDSFPFLCGLDVACPTRCVHLLAQRPVPRAVFTHTSTVESILCLDVFGV